MNYVLRWLLALELCDLAMHLIDLVAAVAALIPSLQSVASGKLSNIPAPAIFAALWDAASLSRFAKPIVYQGCIGKFQKLAGLHRLLLTCRLFFRSQSMGVGQIPVGEITARLREPSADPHQLDKLTISTIQASRWMLAGGLQASRQAQLFPGRRVIWQLATMLEKVLHDDWSIIATGKFKQARC